MSEGLNSRLCALKTLQSVFDGGKPLDGSLEKHAEKLNLSKQDRAFAHALCGFVLRYKPALQQSVNEAANRKADITPLALNTLLLIGAAQIYLMDVPDHAAVDTAVNLTYTIQCSKQKGLVNAVLRRLTREGQKDLQPALPQWLVKTWEADYGVETAKAIAQASLKEAQIAIVNKGGDFTLLSPFDSIKGSMQDPLIKSKDDGFSLTPDQWIQDFASHYPVSLLPDLDGKTVLDLCAAPGGKTMQLAAKGATVTAVDVSETRLRRLYENLERTQLADRVDVVRADLLKWEPRDKADYIILDAPCSATGTIRRHPDLPYIRTNKDMAALVKLQAQLLDRVKDWLKPEGVLVYCTCSLQKDEGERQVEAFLEHNKDFDKVVMKSDYNNEAGDIRLLPSYGAMDGFFISYLKRIKP